MQAYKIMARNISTGERVMEQQLSGRRITNPREAEQLSISLADRMSQKTGLAWIGEFEAYTAKKTP